MEWWKTAVFYQIYPRSFYDSNSDGIGDLRGISQKLDYLTWLGIDALWISPFYPSPMKDFGYDVADYTDVDPIFGSIEDFDHLLTEAHRRKLKVIIDLVPNHTSDQHPWFLDSRTGRNSRHRDWYIWRDPGPDGGPPNNWLGLFDGKPAWCFDEVSGQYYLHSFLPEQPDLNWRNPEVVEAMDAVVMFWLERGVDGFRVDVSYRTMKDRQLRDNPVNPDWKSGMDPSHRVIEKFNKNTPDIRQFNRHLRSVCDRFPDIVLVGEMYLPFPELVKHYGETGDEFHLPFNFSLIGTAWEPESIAGTILRYEQALPSFGWPNWVLGNHDQHRIATRAGRTQARNAMMLLLTLRGTPTMYYGEELGMEDVEIPPGQAQDPWEKNVPGLGLGRDPERTPMQWTADDYAGFSSVAPWLPVHDDYHVRNVENEMQNPQSDLLFVRHLLSVRRQSPDLTRGAVSEVLVENRVLSYRRGLDTRIFINFSASPEQIDLCSFESQMHIAAASSDQAKIEGGALHLPGNQSVILVSLSASEDVEAGFD